MESPHRASNPTRSEKIDRIDAAAATASVVLAVMALGLSAALAWLAPPAHVTADVLPLAPAPAPTEHAVP